MGGIDIFEFVLDYSMFYL